MCFFVDISRAKKYLAFTYSEKRKKSNRKNQGKDEINEFYELLENLEDVEVISTDINS